MNEWNLLQAMNGIHTDTVERTRQLLENKEVIPMYRMRNVWRTVLIAALIARFFSITAYAVFHFSMNGHSSAENESYTVQFGNQAVEWPSKYVFRFEGPEECRGVRFKANWTPKENYWDFAQPEDDGYASLLEGGEIRNEEFGVFLPSCVIDVMYAPQFVNDGAMILMDFEPDKITEESWGDVQVYKFAAKSGHAIDADQTMFPIGNFVILFHPEQGWIVGVRGYDSMENLEQIARNLEVVQTEEVIRSTDFENKIDFCDIYIG